MGQEIVFQESPNEPGERSRLWRYEDVHHIFVKNTGTEKVRGIMVKNLRNRRGEKILLGGKSFLKLTNLQVFIISSDIFTGNHVDCLSNELRLLDWFCCPLVSFPSTFNPKKLVVLNMPGSQTSPLGEVPKILFQVKMPWSCTAPLEKGLEIMPNLKSINLSNCDGLTKVSDFSRFPNLVDLNLTGCENLVELDHSVGFLKNLVNLDLRFCKKLRKLEINKEMKSLKRLDLRETAIKELPSSSIGYLINLEELSFERCNQLTDVPCSILNLQHLQYLCLRQCEKLVEFPTHTAISTNFSTTSVRDPLYVDLSGCNNLEYIENFHREIDVLLVGHCPRLHNISKLSDILEGKDSKMIPRMNLSYCRILCHTLAKNYKRENYVQDNSEVTALLSLFLSCRQSEFMVRFPALSGVPKWFSCSMEIEWPDKKGFKVCNFIIEFPPNFKWGNKGLAFCIQTDRWYSSCAIYINDVGIFESKYPISSITDFNSHMWLYYVPFDTIRRRLTEGKLPPTLIFQVDFHLEYTTLDGDGYVGSCGVHVVMPEDEGLFVNGVFHQLEAHQQSAETSNLEAHQQKPSNLRRRKVYCIK
ncbi:hypothetical protein M0R45_007991 [Rubus argutus]